MKIIFYFFVNTNSDVQIIQKNKKEKKPGQPNFYSGIKKMSELKVKGKSAPKINNLFQKLMLVGYS